MGASVMPYRYGQDADPATLTDEQRRATNAPQGANGPGLYQPNQPKAPQPQQPQPQSQPMQAQPAARQPQPLPPQTFAQMQAQGVARPPMPTSAPTVAPSGVGMPVAPASTSTIFANDPTRPGSGYVMYNGQPTRIEGTTAAGLGADGQPKPVTAQDRYILEGGQQGDFVNPADYNAWVNAPHGADTYTSNAPASGQVPTPGGPSPYGPANMTASPNGPALTSPTGVPAMAGSPANGAAPMSSPMAAPPGGNVDILHLLTNGATGQGAGNAVQNATQQNALNLLNSPSPYGQKQVQDAYNWLGGNIDDQYAMQRQQVGEDMARRGLGPSTINAGRLNDLNIGQRSAKEGLAENLGQNYAQTLGNYEQGAINTGNQVGTSAQNNQQSWLAQLMGFGQNAFNNDLQTNQQNQTAQQSYQNYILQLLGLGYGG